MEHDVIIAGAGPSGSVCALRCAAAGLRTLLLERDTFPRPKPCGGAVSERALGYLGIPLPAGLIERECFGVRIRYGSRTVEARKDRRIAVLVSRERFDRFLAAQAVEAGAILREGEAVREIAALPDRVEVVTERGRYEARCVVGADGANSVTARTVRPLLQRDEMAAALTGLSPADDGEIDRRLDGLIEMDFSVTRLGYGWVFPNRGCFNAGVMGLASEFRDPRRTFREYCAATGMKIDRPLGHTIPWGGFDRPVTGRRTVLVGDAAGFADPFHGEGIANAILSGNLAGRAIAEGIGGRKDALTWYQRECDRLIVDEMRIALRMARMLDRSPGLFLAIFFSDTEALGRYLEIPAGASDYARFQRWLLPRLPRYLMRMLLSEIKGA